DERGVDGWKRVTNGADFAVDQPADSPGAHQEAFQGQGARAARLAAKTRRVHPGEDHHPQEAEFGAAQGCARAALERHRGQHLYSGGRPQPAGALRGADSRRPRARPSRGSLPRYSWNARFDWGAGTSQGPLQVRIEKAEVTTMSRKGQARVREVT